MFRLNDKNRHCLPLKLCMWLAILSVLFTYSARGLEQDKSNEDPDWLRVESFSMPKYSAYLSIETVAGLQEQERLMNAARAQCNPNTQESAADIRACEAKMYAVIMPKALERFAVNIEAKTIAGVQTDVITPKAGISAKNEQRVLINLHGGGFKYGGRFGGQLESMPIAEYFGIKVVTIDYRKAPEHRFPAALTDVKLVYQALLKQYPSDNIGFFGCSAGSRVSGQAIAHLASHSLPGPGAAAFLCSAPTALDGDSNYYAAAMQGRQPLSIDGVEYWEGLSTDNQAAFPGDFSEQLAAFPPSLLITSTRDYSLSPMVAMHRKLVNLDIPAQLHIFEGFTHAQFMSMYVPEARETTKIMSEFFDRFLGQAPLSAVND
ncbi:alpha/beta hydrolase [Ningiella sp. W23]|uniref:alpha/beta hydrolase n=1 Tax=Ningiella sp. W23 TaxID=3023715 RepID=UPI003757BCE3